MKPRVTINLNNKGELEIWLNEAGRDLLVKELRNLSAQSDHFHLQPEGFIDQVPTQSRAYREGDQVLEWGKVLFRPDEWDRKYFPHVFEPTDTSGS